MIHELRLIVMNMAKMTEIKTLSYKYSSLQNKMEELVLYWNSFAFS